MRFASLGQPTTVGALHAGECFAFDWHGEVHIGIKIIDEFATHPIAACAVIWPGHPDLDNRPGFLDESMVPGTGVYALSDAVIVPSADLATWRVSTDLASEAGVVLLAKDRMLMGVARRNGKVVFIDLAAGKTALLPDGTSLLRIASWRVVQKVFDSFETICCYETPDCAASRTVQISKGPNASRTAEPAQGSGEPAPSIKVTADAPASGKPAISVAAVAIPAAS
jgi:hypothetical protein